ncbi:MAG: glucosamine-6-phosphate deaminase, partial [Clostridia bacterium]|nr:glucosamine-6-phosphate deaminase [Clostridia bacterium]
MKRSFVKDSLRVGIYESRAEMGAAAAADVSACIAALMKEKPFINMIFAAAPSQNEVLASLAADRSICWERINAFHMDEYIGLDRDAPQGFGNFLKEHLFELVPFATVNLIS